MSIILTVLLELELRILQKQRCRLGKMEQDLGLACLTSTQMLLAHGKCFEQPYLRRLLRGPSELPYMRHLCRQSISVLQSRDRGITQHV